MSLQQLFNRSAALIADLVSRLIFSRWARDYEEHHGQCEDAYAARLGPLHLEINRCFVLDHEDAFISVHIPIPIRHAQSLHEAGQCNWGWSTLYLGYVICRGEDEIRRPGFYAYRLKPLPRPQPGQAACNLDGEFPF